jgi:hypothetical protein
MVYVTGAVATSFTARNNTSREQIVKKSMRLK